VSFLLSLVAIAESCAVFDRIHAHGGPVTHVSLLDQVLSDSVDVETATQDKDAAESQTGEATWERGFTIYYL
jgi:hypothetical protein